MPSSKDPQELEAQEEERKAEERRVDKYAFAMLDAARSGDRASDDLPDEVSASPEMLSVLNRMAASGDIRMMAKVMKRYRQLKHENPDLVGVYVTTAIPLDDELRDLIRTKCENDLGKEVYLIERVDKSIIGGIIISINNDLRDVSVRHQLEAAEDIMTQNLREPEV